MEHISHKACIPFFFFCPRVCNVETVQVLRWGTPSALLGEKDFYCLMLYIPEEVLWLSMKGKNYISGKRSDIVTCLAPS